MCAWSFAVVPWVGLMQMVADTAGHVCNGLIDIDRPLAVHAMVQKVQSGLGDRLDVESDMIAKG